MSYSGNIYGYYIASSDIYKENEFVCNMHIIVKNYT